VYLNPKDGDEGYAIAAGGGAELPLGQYFTLFGEGYYSPDSMSSGVEDYVEANAGVRLNVLPSLNIEAGYRYIDMAGKDGN
ncbi:YfaZ family outer membrane protein, partial [Klebsiella pneumoniae]